MVRSQFRAWIDSRAEYQKRQRQADPMNATVRALLESQPKTSSYVFPSPRTGQRLVEIKYSFARAIKDAKITDLRFHDLRHTAATRMGDVGADAFTLAAIFGWSDIRMAMRYTHAMEDAKRRAVEAIAQRQIPRDHSVTNEKPVADQIGVSG